MGYILAVSMGLLEGSLWKTNEYHKSYLERGIDESSKLGVTPLIQINRGSYVHQNCNAVQEVKNIQQCSARLNCKI